MVMPAYFPQDGEEFDSDASVNSVGCRFTNRAVACSNNDGPVTSNGLGRAAALGMDIFSPSEKQDRSVLKRASTTPTVSTSSTASSSSLGKKSRKPLLFRANTTSRLPNHSSKKKNLFSLLKKKRNKKKQEDDIVTTNAVAHLSHRSLVNTLGMAAEPPCHQQQVFMESSFCDSDDSCPGILDDVLRDNGNVLAYNQVTKRQSDNDDILPGLLDSFLDRKFSLASNQVSNDARNTVDAVIDPQESSFKPVDDHQSAEDQSKLRKESSIDALQSALIESCCCDKPT